LIARISALGHSLVEAANAEIVVREADEAVPFLLLENGSGEQAGQLPMDVLPEVMDAALRAVAVGLTVRVGRGTHALEEHPQRVGSNLLTPRELEILNAIGAGSSNKAIARQLGISLHTVKFHVESLFRKLGARTRAEAVAIGLARRTAEIVEI
ncbi:MAG: response regulator transcription factor, partial [Povalibacter sp.]